MAKRQSTAMMIAGLSIVGGALAVLGSSTTGHAQVVEQNPARTLHGEQKVGLPGSTLTVSRDKSPFGVSLRRLSIVNVRDGDAPTHISMVDLSGAETALQTPELEALLQSFVGQPMSQKLVDDIRATITQYYRDTNRPLVAVTVPPQEISDGNLRVEVLPFQLAETKTEGNSWTADDHLKGTIRARAGEEIDSAQLIDDANWLNLNPYRNLSLVFEPGQKVGTTNLILRSDEQKPWTVYSGVSNGGTNTSDPLRFYTGFNVANIPAIDHQVSYQFTTSGKAAAQARVFTLDDNEGYLSHSLSTFTPLDYANGWRHKARLQASYVDSFSELNSAFTLSNSTVQLYGEYAIPLPKFGGIKADLYTGIDFKRQSNDIYFNGALSSSTQIDVVQGMFGILGDFTSPLHITSDGRTFSGRGDFNLRLVGSAGGLTSNNSDAAFAAASTNPNVSASYVYLYGEIGHIMPLPKRFAFKHELAFQLASTALPGLEQFSVGGASSVRGYLTNEASGDDGISLRNEFALPSFSFFGETGKQTDRVVPYLFADIGWSNDRFADRQTTLAGVGAGFDYAIGQHLNAAGHVGYALTDGTQTQSGDINIFGSLTLRF